jgi:hypothetical protein
LIDRTIAVRFLLWKISHGLSLEKLFGFKITIEMIGIDY